MWAIEFEGDGRMYRLLERAQRGLFAQLVVVPLFRDHRILTQVAGHNMAVVKVLPPLMLGDDDLEEFVDALRETVEQARRMPSALTKFALAAARR
jgi:ornithine--oxo-acid transaminase